MKGEKLRLPHTIQNAFLINLELLFSIEISFNKKFVLVQHLGFRKIKQCGLQEVWIFLLAA